MRNLLVSSIAMSAALFVAVPVMAQDTAPAGDVAPVGDVAVVETPAATVVVTVPEGYTILGFDTVTTEQLTGARLYDAEGNDVAEIADIVLDGENKVSGIVTDVGGFLGMGEHRVLLSPEQVEIYTNTDGETRAYVTLTNDELEALPAYEGE